MGIIWTIIIGFIAGVIAKFIMPGPNEPQGFILTAILGIVGAFVASFLGQMLGWYGPGQGAGLIGAVVGAIIVLLGVRVLCRPKNSLTGGSLGTNAKCPLSCVCFQGYPEGISTPCVFLSLGGAA